MITVSRSMSESQLNKLIEGIERLKNGALTSMLSIVLGILAVIAMLAVFPHMRILNMSLYLNITSANRTAISIIERRLMGALPYLAVSGILFIVASILAIASFILFFMASGSLKEYSERLGLGRTGLIIVLLSLLLILVGGASIAFTMPHAVERWRPLLPIALHLISGIAIIAVLVFLSAILMTVGLILFSIMLIRLSEEKDVDKGFKTAGIIMAAGIVLDLIPFAFIIGLVLCLVALILIYTSAKDSLKNLRSGVIIP